MARPGSTSTVVAAFTEDQVERLTGITRYQLRYWDKTGFFAPQFADDDRRAAFSRIYSFRDIVSLQVLNTLRNEVRVSLPHLREVKEKLAHLGDDAWARVTLYVVKKKVVFDDPETNTRREIVSGQGILQIPLEVVRAKMEERVAVLRERDRSEVGEITQTRRVAGNAPVISGTRVPVRAVQAFAAEGLGIEDIQKEYPTLSAEDIRAALSYGKAA